MVRKRKKVYSSSEVAEEQKRAFDLYIKGYGLSEIGRRLGRHRSTIFQWKEKNIPADWDKNKARYQTKSELKNKELQLYSDKELIEMKNLDRFLRLQDRNWTNFAIILQGLSNKLNTLFKNQGIEKLTLKEMKDYMVLVEKVTHQLNILFGTIMPDPKGYILIDEVNVILGNLFENTCKIIQSSPLLDPDAKLDLINEVTTYAVRQSKNLSMRKDLTTLTMEEGRDVIMRQYQQQAKKLNQEIGIKHSELKKDKKKD